MTAHALAGRTARWTTGAVLCLLAATGCGAGADGHAAAQAGGSAATSGNPAPGSPESSAQAGAPGSSTSPAGAGGSQQDFSRRPVAVASTQKGQLVSVTAGSSDGVDRLVFTFSGAAPGYRVEPVERVTTGATNDPAEDVVEIAGKSLLSVAFTYTTPNVHGEISPKVPTNTDLNLPLLRQIVLVHNVAGNVRFGVGLATGSPSFRVVTSQDPARITVEIRNR